MQITTLRYGETGESLERIAPDSALFKAKGADLPSMIARMPELAGAEAPWYEIAKVEEASGVEEISGKRHNPRILEYHATTDLHANDDETPWCSSFVNWCVREAGYAGTNSAWARSWLKWGRELKAPLVGCIAVLSRPPDPTSGHVAFFVREESASRILLLGGNQGDQVSYQTYRKDRVLQWRWAP